MNREMLDKIKEAANKPLETIAKDGISSSNLDYLYKLIDIQKDIANIEYWKVKEEDFMKYGEGSYGRGGYGRGGYGNYGEYGAYGEGSYGRRGNFRARGPEDKMDEMFMNYQAYSEGREAYGRSGNYSAKEDSVKGLEKMLESAVDLFKMLKEQASSQEEMELVHKYAKKISEM